jgi:hypothetical protein
MAILTTNLTAREDEFVELMCEGLSPGDAASGAGYPARSYIDLLQSPRITRRIEWRMRSVIRNDLAPKAIRLLGRLVDDEAAPARVRVQAARFILDRAGYVPPKAADVEVNDKSIAAMPADELSALVNKLEGELASRAKDVSAPNAAVHDNDLSEMLG